MKDPMLPDLPDADYWGDPRQALDAVLDKRMVAKLLGPAIGAPARVPLQGRDTLPVWGAWVEPLGRHGPSVEDLAVVVASSLESGKVHAGPAFPPRDFIDAPQPASPDPPPVGTSGALFKFDLYSRLEELQRRPAAYAVWVLVQGRKSNCVRSQLYGGGGVTEDPEVGRFIDEYWRTKGPPKAWPTGAAAAGERSEDAPPVPAEPGISLHVPRVHVLDEKPCWLTGSYRLDVLPRHLVTPDLAGGGVHAMLPITLVMTSENFAGPFVARLRIACNTPLEPGDPHPTATGRFAVDLMSLPGMWRQPRTLFLYAFLGAVASEAAVVSLLPPEMLED